jgi:hypothetical protein
LDFLTRNQHLPASISNDSNAYRLYSTMPRRQLRLSFPKVPTLRTRMLADIERSTHCIQSLSPQTLTLTTWYWYATTRWPSSRCLLSSFAQACTGHETHHARRPAHLSQKPPIPRAELPLSSLPAAKRRTRLHRGGHLSPTPRTIQRGVGRGVREKSMWIPG